MLFSLAPCFSSLQARGGERHNIIFHMPHLLQSPYTLPSGKLIYGTTVALGVTDFLQVSTDLFSDLFRIYNASLKASLVDEPDYAISLSLGWKSYRLQDISTTNPNLSVSSISPGAVLAIKMEERMAVFVGGRADFKSVSFNSQAVQTSGWVQGALIETDFSWAYGNPKQQNNFNAIASGISYDFTYQLWGFGMSHHWPGFQLGFHYYPEASRNPVLPILIGGGSIEL